MGSEPPAMASKSGNLDAALLEGGPAPDFFQRFFGAFPDPVIVFDMQSSVVFLNDSARTLTGRTLNREYPLICVDILREFGECMRTSLIERCLKDGILDRVPVQLRGASGDWLPFSLSAQPAADCEGSPAGIVAVLRSAPADSTSAGSPLGPIFSSVINNFPMPFFTVDTDLVVTYMNDHLEKLTGYASSEVVNRMTCAELLRTAECNTCDCSIRQAMESRNPIPGLRRTVIDRKGRKIPVAMHASMITDSRGNVIGGFEAIRDITSVAEAEQKIRMLIEVTQEGILMVDENDRVIYANSKMAEILEQHKDGLIGKDVSGLLPFQHLNITHDLIQKVDSEHPQALRFCTTIQPGRVSEEYQAFETCIVVSRVGKSLITCMYFHDLTKHIEIERQLYDANSFLNNIIMSSADGIVVADTAGKILIFNESAERILGYSAEEVIGRPEALERVAGLELAREIMRRMRSNEYGPPRKGYLDPHHAAEKRQGRSTRKLLGCDYS